MLDKLQGQRGARPLCSPHVPVRTTFRAAAALAFALVFSGSAAAQDLDGVLRLFMTRTELLDETADAYGGTLDMRWKRQVTPEFGYLLALRYAGESQALLLAPDLGASTNRDIEPRVELNWLTEELEISVGQRWIDRRTRGDFANSIERDESNTFGHFLTTFERMPNVLIEYDRRDTSQDLGVSQLSTRLLGQLTYSRLWWTASAGWRHSVRDIELSVEREVDESLFTASLSRPLASGRVNVFANYNYNDLEGKDRLDRETLVPVPRLLLQGLLAQDDTPLDGLLVLEPALIDGDTATPTAADIGGGLTGGSTNWNIGVELALVEFVDAIDLWLAQPIPSENAVRYSFSVHHSDDGRTWTLATSAAARSYNQFDGRFLLTFGAVTDRFIKVVNNTVDDTLGPVFVSEIELHGRELRQGVVESRTRTENAAVAVSWTPLPEVTTTLTGSTNRIRSETESSRTRSRDDTLNLTLNAQPLDKIATTVALLNSSRTRTDQEDEADRAYSVSLTTFPYRDLDLTVVGSIRDRERGADQVRSRSMLLRAASLLHQGLTGSIDYEWADEENFDVPAQDRRTLRAALDVRPRESINFITTYLSETIEVPALVSEDRKRDNIQWRNRLTLRPSGVLSLTFEATRFELVEQEGWARIAQVDWLPFAGGAIQLSLDYRKDAPLTGDDRTIRSIGLRWNMNPRMFLDIDGTRQTQAIGGAELGRTIYTALFQARL